MGLDMYLFEEIYIGAHWKHDKIDTSECKLTANGRELPIDWKNLHTVTTQIGYWRKANQIHNWFVQNVQNGLDDCEKHTFSFEKLKELYLLCKKILDAPEEESKTLAQEELPSKDGFFFGSTNYDDNYFIDLQNTVDILEPLIADSLENKILNEHTKREFIYESSW